MFKHNFSFNFPQQRRALLEADSFAPIPIHPAVERQLKLLAEETPVSAAGGTLSSMPTSATHLFAFCLREMNTLVRETIAWSAVHALLLLGAVLISRELLTRGLSVPAAISLAAGFFLVKLAEATVQYHNHLRQLQVHRGVQSTLYRLVNSKLTRVESTTDGPFSPGQLKTLIGSDVDAVEDFFSAALRQWTPILVSMLILVPTILALSGWVGLFALASVLLLVPVAFSSAALIERLQRRSQAEQDLLATLVGEWVKNIRLVRYLGWDAAIERDLVRRNNKFAATRALRHAVVVLVFAVSFSWSAVPLLSILAFSKLFGTTLHLVEVFSVFWILDNFVSQIQHIPHSVTLFGAAVASARRIVEFLGRPELVRFLAPVPTGAEGLAAPARVHLRNVVVNFGEREALSSLDVSLSLKEKTAVVGTVGSGKTTLLEVLLGERHPTSGELLIEFEDGATWPLWREDVYHHFRSHIAYSAQQPFLSNSSFRSNVDLSDRYTVQELDDAVTAAQLKPDLLLFPHGLDEEVGETGINLSGGQKHRVSLARAFIAQRALLVLDDPLSAVDRTTEAALMKEILVRSKGLILVSHRLDELLTCDRVLVLDEGRLVEDGSPRLLAEDTGSRFFQFLTAVDNHG